MQPRVTIGLGSFLLGIAGLLLGLASAGALLPVVQDRAGVTASPFVVSLAALSIAPSAFGLSYVLAAGRPGRRGVAWASAVAPWLAFALCSVAAFVSGCARDGGGCG